MKILMLNRPDAYTKIGGDTIQMIETKKELEKFGVNIDIALGPQEIDVYRNYDIIHLFNIQTVDFSYKEALKIKAINKILVLSPIWWSFQEEYFKHNFTYVSVKAKLVGTVFGKRLSSYAYKLKLYLSNKKASKIIQMADYIMPNSFLEFYNLLTTFGDFDLDKVKVVYNGVSKEFLTDKSFELPDELRQRGFKSKEFALQVSRIEPHKNTLTTIKCCKKLNIPLVLIGNIGDSSYFKEVSREFNENVLYLGYKNYLELLPYYYNARIHILPSYRETPGLSNLEAGSLGCGIVTTIVGTAVEYFKDFAYYCIPWDENSVERAILKCWDNPNGEALKNIIRSEYTWENAAFQTLNVYKKMINS